MEFIELYKGVLNLLIFITQTHHFFIIKTNGYQAIDVVKIRKIPGRVWVIAELEWHVPRNEETIRFLHEWFGPEQVRFETSLREEEPLIQKWFPYDAATTKVIQEYLIQLSEQMTLKGFSSKTKKAYEGHIRRFCQTYSEEF